MNLLCLCPTYGRHRSLLENTLACFDAQDYPAEKRRLALYDDLGTLRGTTVPSGIAKIATDRRARSIGAKYNDLLRVFPEYDAYVVWDDDDVYLPWHLSAHAAVLANRRWSKPSTIFSTYGQPVGGTITERSAGRFHGSIAVRWDMLTTDVLGWADTRRADFDQQMIGRLEAVEPPGDPCLIAPPSYIYRWQDSGGGHCSGLMRSPENEDWYDRYQPDNREPIVELRPRFDGVTGEIWLRLAKPYSLPPAISTSS